MDAKNSGKKSLNCPLLFLELFQGLLVAPTAPKPEYNWAKNIQENFNTADIFRKLGLIEIANLG